MTFWQIIDSILESLYITKQKKYRVGADRVQKIKKKQQILFTAVLLPMKVQRWFTTNTERGKTFGFGGHL